MFGNHATNVSSTKNVWAVFWELLMVEGSQGGRDNVGVLMQSLQTTIYPHNKSVQLCDEKLRIYGGCHYGNITIRSSESVEIRQAFAQGVTDHE